MTSFADLDDLVGAVPFDVVTALRTVDAAQGTGAVEREVPPAVLVALAERCRAESVEASCAMDGVVVAGRSRAADILAGDDHRLRGRDEQRLAGCRRAHDHLRDAPWRPLDVPVVLHLHELLLSCTVTPGGRLRHAESAVAVGAQDGPRVKRYTPVPVAQLPQRLEHLVDGFRAAQDEGRHHPVLVVGLLVLDLLAIHPFTEGNGRVARALTSALLQDAGYDVVRYVSLDAAMAVAPDRYATALLAATQDWDVARHDPWPWLRYLVLSLADCSTRFVETTAAARTAGSKQDLVRDHVLHHAARTFRLDDLRAALPGVSDPTLRLVLGRMRDEGLVRADAVGRGATWTRRG